MKIMYICSYYKPAYAYGGPVSGVSALLEALVSMGVDVNVFTTDANGNERLNVSYDGFTNIDGVEVYYHPRGADRISKSAFHSSQLIQNVKRKVKNYDVVLVDGLWSSFLPTSVENARAFKKPVVVLFHGQLMPWARNFKAIKKAIYLNLVARPAINKSTAIYCETSVEYQGLKNLDLTRPVFIVPFGIDSSQFTMPIEKGFLRKRFALDQDASILIQVGRLHQVKSPELSVAALGLLKRSNVHLVFVGPDEEGLMPALLQQARSYNCEKQVHFTGLIERNDVIRALVDSDLFMMPSLMECFGMAALEAMAAGVPILTSDSVPVGHAAALKNAGVVARGNPEAFALEIAGLLDDRVALGNMGMRAREVAQNEFDIKIVAKRLINELQVLILTGKPATPLSLT
jgi:glycosyltransferase involved in cell wall biosynthesis